MHFVCSALAHIAQIRLAHHTLSFRLYQILREFMCQELLAAVPSFIRDMLEFHEDHTT